MSTTIGSALGYKPTIDSSSASKTIKEYFSSDNPKKLIGTKYAHIGNRTGLGSLLDSEIVKKNLQHQAELLGPGFVKVARVDGGGNVVHGAAAGPMNIDGRTIYPDDKGNYLIIDSTAVNKMVQREKERMAYIERVMNDAYTSDSVCAILCGMDVPTLRGFLGDRSTAPKEKGRPIWSTDFNGVDAMPETIHSYDPNSVTCSKAIRKLKLFIEFICPVVEDLTNKKALDGDADKKGADE